MPLRQRDTFAENAALVASIVCLVCGLLYGGLTGWRSWGIFGALLSGVGAALLTAVGLAVVLMVAFKKDQPSLPPLPPLGPDEPPPAADGTDALAPAEPAEQAVAGAEGKLARALGRLPFPPAATLLRGDEAAVRELRLSDERFNSLAVTARRYIVRNSPLPGRLATLGVIYLAALLLLMAGGNLYFGPRLEDSKGLPAVLDDARAGAVERIELLEPAPLWTDDSLAPDRYAVDLLVTYRGQAPVRVWAEGAPQVVAMLLGAGVPPGAVEVYVVTGWQRNLGPGVRGLSFFPLILGVAVLIQRRLSR